MTRSRKVTAEGNPSPRQEQGIAIVGSSNFTLSSVTTNSELSMLVHGNANHAARTRWFDELWAEAHQMRELRQSWPLAQVTPDEIYLKTLYELMREGLRGPRPFCGATTSPPCSPSYRSAPCARPSR